MLNISLCSSTSCPRYSECYRGSAEKHSGIHTVTDYIQECSEVNNFPWYIPVEDWKKKI